MSKTFRDWEPDRVWLLPPSLQDLVPPGHVAQFVRDTVHSGLGAILESYGEEPPPPVSPGNDGRAAALRLQPGCVLLAPDGTVNLMVGSTSWFSAGVMQKPSGRSPALSWPPDRRFDLPA